MYWTLFIVPAAVALFSAPRRPSFGFALLLLFIFLAIAFRESGGDFYTYNLMYNAMAHLPLSDAVSFTDPAYGFVNWLSAQFDWQLYGVNAVCAVLFLFCFSISLHMSRGRL